MTDIYSKPVMVDPPSGHRYGFPKLYDPKKEEGTMFDWLVREGYPQSEIDRYQKALMLYGYMVITIITLKQ